jgi:hypothetical protein
MLAKTIIYFATKTICYKENQKVRPKAKSVVIEKRMAGCPSAFGSIETSAPILDGAT